MHLLTFPDPHTAVSPYDNEPSDAVTQKAFDALAGLRTFHTALDQAVKQFGAIESVVIEGRDTIPDPADLVGTLQDYRAEIACLIRRIETGDLID